MNAFVATTSGAEAPLVHSRQQIRWMILLRLLVTVTFTLGALIIQVTSLISSLKPLYTLFAGIFALSGLWLVLERLDVNRRVQIIIQLLGDLAAVTGLVYLTGGIYSPFSFLFLCVIATAAILLPSGGLAFAGMSAVAYGVLVDLMVLGYIPGPPGDAAIAIESLPVSRVLYQLFINLVGFILLALLVTWVARNLRQTRATLHSARQHSLRMAALADHLIRSVDAGLIALQPDGTILHLNPAALQLLGLESEAEATAQVIDDLLPMPNQGWDPLLEQARNGQIGRSLISHEGIEIGIQTGPLADESSRQVGLVVTLVDRTVAERETARDRATERMAALGEMASRMAHEIRNPLASISGSAQVLTSLKGLDRRSRRLLEIMVDESRRLSAILESFLDFTRPSRVPDEQLDLVALLKDCLELLQASESWLPSHRLALRCPTSYEIYGNRDQLGQVFWNLAHNSIAAMPTGGRLDILVEGRPDGVHVCWSDNGEGMTEEIVQRAFEPFMTTRAGGTGLGLAVVYSVISEHAGSIEINSSPGSGTTLNIELPAASNSHMPSADHFEPKDDNPVAPIEVTG